MNSSTASIPVNDVVSDRRAAPKKRIASLLAIIGSLIVLASTLMPWYRTGADHLLHTAWQESPVVLALLLAVAIAGAALAAAGSHKRSVRRSAGASVFGLTLITTIAVVVGLFIDRPGGNAATTLAFGGYPALLGINLVKASGTLMLVRRR